MVMLLTDGIIRRYQATRAVRHSIEHATGQGIPSASGCRRDLASLDLTTLTTHLNRRAVDCSDSERDISWLRANLQRLRASRDEVSLPSSVDTAAEAIMWGQADQTDDALQTLWSELSSLQRRIELQLNVVYNLAVQRDSRLSLRIAQTTREVAAATKRDSSSMKALATLTAVFLPGTSMAALFSMPLFDWKAAPGSPVVSPRLWLYWAITGPLTILVLVIYGLWTKLGIVQHAREIERVQDSDEEVDGLSIETAHSPTFLQRSKTMRDTLIERRGSALPV
ncbi:MAG: hypothetical protein M1817_005547 [Caeruleum heppii]|nr:MAG: hypothetical protein M1817_005547 [Caeruleum heppii]